RPPSEVGAASAGQPVLALGADDVRAGPRPPAHRAPAAGRRNDLRAAPLGVTDRPRVGVGAVLIHQDKVLLIQRGKEPLRGRWVVPGGTVELGETLEEALVREIQEETGLLVRPRQVVAGF